MTVRVVGRDGDAVLIADGPVGAIIAPGVEPVVMPLASLAAHGDFDEASGPLPAGLPDSLLRSLAAARQRFESGQSTEPR